MAKEIVTKERVYTIPLRKECVKQTSVNKVPRGINVIREFLSKHTKAGEIKISRGVNELMWDHGVKRPPGSIKITVELKEGVAFARLPGEEKPGKKKEKPKEEKAGIGKLKEGIEKRIGEKSEDIKSMEVKDAPKKLTPEEEAKQLLKEAEQKIKEEDKKK